MGLQMNLGAYLERRGITAYRLVKATEGRLAPATVYGLAARPAQRIDLATVGTVLEALSALTGSPVQVQDVLETLDAEGDQRREDARRRIAAPRKAAGKLQGSAAPRKATGACPTNWPRCAGVTFDPSVSAVSGHISLAAGLPDQRPVPYPSANRHRAGRTRGSQWSGLS
ncbi:helix-turn-helix transcriptional regulator [Deinococcus sp. QL22]|uniref:helix-turn-helix domain-containing protein n=1 Tax=Deinococcus sp. QL22 TaxID=2939437 RepID=UPI002016CE2E|nr:helix-turn-helix transcriptional regulator [Deinococcus sp. QL22]UQN09443.1 helix-turn-helix transcriptional regulator [Deinococcus sp. QL22]